MKTSTNRHKRSCGTSASECWRNPITSQRSSTFTSLREACYYQGIHGGKVYTISECQTELSEVDEDEFQTKEREGTKYYVLSVSEKNLINRFMYIKEWLLQYHNLGCMKRTTH